MNQHPFKLQLYLFLVNKGKYKIFTIIFDIFILLLILISSGLVLAVIHTLPDEVEFILEISEYILLFFFACEWLIHFYAAEYFYPDSKNVDEAKRRWVFSLSSIIDIICLLTLAINFIPTDSRWDYLRIIKLIKLVKIPEYLWFLHRKNTYHVHTFRCGHARGEDEIYITSAIANGYDRLGFADHIPFPDRNQENVRQSISSVGEYVASINKLKEKYKHRIKIYVGYEAEYYPEYHQYYQDLFSTYNLDYMILGQHCRLDKHNSFEFYHISKYRNDYNNLKDYVDHVILGMRSGFFKYVAHPDLIMDAFDDLKDPQLLFEMRRIIIESIKYDIPLEINLGGAKVKNHHMETNYLGEPYVNHYPYEEFFMMVGELGGKVIIGLDAHIPLDFYKNEYKYAINMVKKYKLTLVDKINI